MRSRRELANGLLEQKTHCGILSTQSALKQQVDTNLQRLADSLEYFHDGYIERESDEKKDEVGYDMRGNGTWV